MMTTDIRRSADVEYAETLKERVLNWCTSSSLDPTKIKLSEVKDNFKSFHLNILTLVMELLCEEDDRRLMSNTVGRMTYYSVISQQASVSKTSIKQEDKIKVPKVVNEEKENIFPGYKQEVSIDKKRKPVSSKFASNSTASSTGKKAKIASETKSKQIRIENETKSKPNMIDSTTNQKSSLQESEEYNCGITSLFTPSNEPEPRTADDSLSEADIEFVTLALYRIFDGATDMTTSLSALEAELPPEVEVMRCLRYLEKRNTIMIYNDDIYLI
mmetsp:Transcript_8638/g.12888  ORF Transcript_8638/g.12888 Transcript_8638/m.12888 type:complete len:272 (-) Transcript_8638:270-1085(-)